MALEMTGARIFIPWFGSSILVWSNVIGVTLGSVAVGNFLGGRLADRQPKASLLALLLALSAVLTALVPYVAPPLARRYLPEGLELASAFALMGRASLIVAILSLGPPLVLLGMATPFLVRGATRDEGGRVARAAGLISGAATCGSLLGTWAPVYYLIPALGSRLTCVASGAAILAGAVIAAVACRPVRALPALMAGFLLVGALALAAEKGVGRTPVAAEVLAEIETRYQYARVERKGEMVSLRLNEGLDSYHSLYLEGSLLTGGYFDWYGLYPPLVGTADGPREVLILGYAAGTIGRQLLGLYGDRFLIRITGVEIDSDVAALGPRFFGAGPDRRLDLIVDQDARAFLNQTTRRFDLIVVDTYSDQIYVPFQLCSEEFFRSARARLKSGGGLVANLGGFSMDDAPVEAIRNTAAAVFGEAALLQVKGGRNYVLSAGLDGPLDPRRFESGYPEELAAILAAARTVGAWRSGPVTRSVPILTDDRSNIELLADRDLLEKSRLLLGEASAR
ncbi:MAG: fused MFS/spermidine synthase [Planctomycetota bacterium]